MERITQMFPANAYVIRRATDDDGYALSRLAQLDGQRPLAGQILIGEIDGRAAAAISLIDSRVVADPFEATAQLSALLRMRTNAIHAYARTPSLRERMLAGVRVTGAWRPVTA
jgi:hypothetical protein